MGRVRVLAAAMALLAGSRAAVRNVLCTARFSQYTSSKKHPCVTRIVMVSYNHSQPTKFKNRFKNGLASPNM